MATQTDTPASRTQSACIWCGHSGDPAPVLPRLARCRGCGVLSTHPPPSEVELEAAYDSWYRPEGGRFSGPGDRLLRRSRSRLAGRIDAIAPAGPILDVGSGDGALVAALRERGRPAWGVERRQPAAPEVEANAGEWSGVVLWHVLEHLPDPGEQVDALPAALRPGGVVLIAVPNSESLQARIFGGRWFHLDLPRHLVHLSASALTVRLERIGLSVERTSHLRGGQIVFGWLQGLVGSLPGAPDLYDAIRRPGARSRPVSGPRRLMTLLAGAVLCPLAVVLSGFEVLVGRGGTVYVEARHV